MNTKTRWPTLQSLAELGLNLEYWSWPKPCQSKTESPNRLCGSCSIYGAIVLSKEPSKTSRGLARRWDLRRQRMMTMSEPSEVVVLWIDWKRMKVRHGKLGGKEKENTSTQLCYRVFSLWDALLSLSSSHAPMEEQWWQRWSTGRHERHNRWCWVRSVLVCCRASVRPKNCVEPFFGALFDWECSVLLTNELSTMWHWNMRLNRTVIIKWILESD